MAPKHTALEIRFWRRTDKRSPAECWPWIGFLDRDGYGFIGGGGRGGRNLRAHRVSWEIANGIQPGQLTSALVVCHSCDNPGCVNPAHLFVGTQKDNIQDMDRKKRSRRPILKGSASGNAKLTEIAIKEIRWLLAQRFSDALIAAEFNVSNACVWSIRKGYTWRHVE